MHRTSASAGPKPGEADWCGGMWDRLERMTCGAPVEAPGRQRVAQRNELRRCAHVLFGVKA